VNATHKEAAANARKLQKEFKRDIRTHHKLNRSHVEQYFELVREADGDTHAAGRYLKRGMTGRPNIFHR
jgi:hypothetical protein